MATTTNAVKDAQRTVAIAAEAMAEACQALIDLEYQRPDDRSVAHATSQAGTITDDLGYLLARVQKFEEG